MAGASDEPEIIRVTINKSFVYKLPVRPSAEGHKAKEWRDQVWAGRTQFVRRGDEAAIRLSNPSTGKVFAVAPVRIGGPPVLEKVSDSSRYFVLRVENAKGKHAFIGLAMSQRSDAFDLQIALSEFEEERKLETEPVKIDYGPKQKLQLDEGETIAIDLTGLGGGGSSSGKPASSSGAASGGAAGDDEEDLFGLPPPPKAGAGASRSGGDGDADDLLALGAAPPKSSGRRKRGGGGGGGSGSSAAAPVPAPAPAAGGEDDWVSFD